MENSSTNSHEMVASIKTQPMSVIEQESLENSGINVGHDNTVEMLRKKVEQASNMFAYRTEGYKSVVKLEKQENARRKKENQMLKEQNRKLQRRVAAKNQRHDKYKMVRKMSMAVMKKHKKARMSLKQAKAQEEATRKKVQFLEKKVLLLQQAEQLQIQEVEAARKDRDETHKLAASFLKFYDDNHEAVEKMKEASEKAAKDAATKTVTPPKVLPTVPVTEPRVPPTVPVTAPRMAPTGAVAPPRMPPTVPATVSKKPPTVTVASPRKPHTVPVTVPRTPPTVVPVTTRRMPATVPVTVPRIPPTATLTVPRTPPTVTAAPPTMPTYSPVVTTPMLPPMSSPYYQNLPNQGYMYQTQLLNLYQNMQNVNAYRQMNTPNYTMPNYANFSNMPNTSVQYPGYYPSYLQNGNQHQ